MPIKLSRYLPTCRKRNNVPVKVVGMLVLHLPVVKILFRASTLLKIIATAAPSANWDESQHDSNGVHLSVSQCSPEKTASCNVDAPRNNNNHILVNILKSFCLFTTRECYFDE